jgi:CBS domain-containing protein
MRIKELLDRKHGTPVTIDANSTVHDAIVKMNEHRVGALVVTDLQISQQPAEGNTGHRHVRYSWGGSTKSVMQSQAICGVVSERDVMVECGERCPGSDASKECHVLVRDVMTKDEDLIIGLPDDDVDYALRVMSGRNIKHLPILNGGELAGIISLGDIVKAKVEDKEYEARMLKDYIQGIY